MDILDRDDRRVNDEPGRVGLDLREYLANVMATMAEDDCDNSAWLYRKLHALAVEVRALDAKTPEQYEDRKDCMEDAKLAREQGWGR